MCNGSNIHQQTPGKIQTAEISRGGGWVFKEVKRRKKEKKRKDAVTKEKNEIWGENWIAFNEESPLKILG